MERLTYWNNKEKGSALPVETDDGLDTVDMETICAKLAAYEDSGLGPEVVSAMNRNGIMKIDLSNAKFPIEWGKEYYTVDGEPNPCECCGGTGMVEIKGKEYRCPACHGFSLFKEGRYKPYFVKKWRLRGIECASGKNLIFVFQSEFFEDVMLGKRELEKMEIEGMLYGHIKFYAEYEEAKGVADRLNEGESE